MTRRLPTFFLEVVIKWKNDALQKSFAILYGIIYPGNISKFCLGTGEQGAPPPYTTLKYGLVRKIEGHEVSYGIHEHVSWGAQITIMAKKIAKEFGMMRSSRQYLSRKSVQTMFKCLAEPYL